MKLLDLKKNKTYEEKMVLEKEVSKIVFENWNLIFPDIIMIQQEFFLKGEVRATGIAGRIDFFAYNPTSRNFVVVEIKKEYDKNIRSQIYDYADFIEDNYELIVLKAQQFLPRIRPNRNSFELILFAKYFKSNDYSRILKYDYPTKLISYCLFNDNKITLDIHDNSQKEIYKTESKSLFNAINYENNDSKLESFWNFLEDSVNMENLEYNYDYKIDGDLLILRIPNLYKLFVDFQQKKHLPVLSKSELRRLLKNDNSFRGFRRSTRFIDTVTSSATFELNNLKERYRIL